MAIAGWDSYDGQGYEELVPESAYEPDVGEWGPEVGSSWYGEVSDWDSYEIETEAVELVSAGVEARALAGSDAPVELRSWALQGPCSCESID